MELTAGNLSRSRKLWPRTANLRRESCDWAQLRNFRPHMSSSVEIVKTWLGFPYICQIFQISAHAPYIYTCRTKHSHASSRQALSHSRRRLTRCAWVRLTAESDLLFLSLAVHRPTAPLGPRST
eukprot:COSAG01_NODE_2330_length_7890_cov_6.219741_5_plen_124_part_00